MTLSDFRPEPSTSDLPKDPQSKPGGTQASQAAGALCAPPASGSATAASPDGKPPHPPTLLPNPHERPRKRLRKAAEVGAPPGPPPPAWPQPPSREHLPGGDPLRSLILGDPPSQDSRQGMAARGGGEAVPAGRGSGNPCAGSHPQGETAGKGSLRGRGLAAEGPVCGGIGGEAGAGARAGWLRPGGRRGVEERAAAESSSTEERMEEEEGDFREANDTQCALCDDGGTIISCDGPCMRSFHFGYREEEGGAAWEEGVCNPLGIPRDLAQLLSSSSHSLSFQCPNCWARRHQCFVCKQEGVQDREVTRCMVTSCGKFFHPGCAGVAAGNPIICQRHTCLECKDSWDTALSNKGELVPCRRCPTAFHRGCLPPSLLHAQHEQRVWLADLDELGQPMATTEVEHSLMYCHRHQLDDDMTAPHVPPLFTPELLAAWRRHHAQRHPHLPSSQTLLEGEKQRPPTPSSDDSDMADVPLAQRAKQQKPPASFRRLSTRASSPSHPRHASTPRGVPATAAPAPSLPPLLNPEEGSYVEGVGGAPCHTSTGSTPPPSPPNPLSAAVAVGAGVGTSGLGGGGMGIPGEAELASPQPELQATEAGDEEGEGGDGLPPLHWPAEKAAVLAEHDMQAAERVVTLEALKLETRQPKPYDGPLKKTIDEDRLSALEASLRHAAAVARHDPSMLCRLVDKQSTKELFQRHDDLMMVLAPYLHGQRYSSFGRHFTDTALLETVVDKMSVFMRDGDQVVDISCGANHWVPLLRRRCLQEGLVVEGRSYDIIIARDTTDFVLKSWFDAWPATEGLAPPRSLVIGLTPPFGKNNALADRFVERAAQFQPRLIALIVPPRTRIPPNYGVALEDRTLCGGEKFYVPGTGFRSWNRGVPVFRVLVRRDLFDETLYLGNPRHWRRVPCAPPRDPPAPGGPFAQGVGGWGSTGGDPSLPYGPMQRGVPAGFHPTPGMELTPRGMEPPPNTQMHQGMLPPHLDHLEQCPPPVYGGGGPGTGAMGDPGLPPGFGGWGDTPLRPMA